MAILQPARRSQLADELDGDLRKLQHKGLQAVEIQQLGRLLPVARALSRKKTDRAKVEEVLSAAIDALGGKRRVVARLWFGLDPTTQGRGVTARHEVAAKQAKVTLKTFRTHKGPAYYPVMAQQIAERYEAWEAATNTRPSRWTARLLAANSQLTWNRRWQVAAVALVAILVIGSAWLRLHSPHSSAKAPPSLAALEARANHLLSRAATPSPGTSSSVLGFGDAAGGRTTYPYTDPTATTRKPTFNSITGMPHGAGDERQFLRVAARYQRFAPLWDANRMHRAAVLSAGQVAWFRVYVDNGAAQEPVCGRLTGETITDTARLRLAVWDSPDRHLHVIRAWLAANNTQPRSVTDAVAVETATAQHLVLDRADSSVNQPGRRAYHAMSLPSGDAFASPGLLVNGTGRVGSCWFDRAYYHLVFKQIRD
jgi:hypothetical protein